MFLTMACLAIHKSLKIGKPPTQAFAYFDRTNRALVVASPSTERLRFKPEERSSLFSVKKLRKELLRWIRLHCIPRSGVEHGTDDAHPEVGSERKEKHKICAFSSLTDYKPLKQPTCWFT
jgi:hypothetical protein